MSSTRPVRLVYPHQLHEAHLGVEAGTRIVVVEDDLLYRQLPFHSHKLVLHRAAVRRFTDRARERGLDVDIVDSRAERTSGAGLVALIEKLRPTQVSVLDVTDDWLGRDCRDQLREGGYELRGEDVLETPAFLTIRAQIHEHFGQGSARMQRFYTWQRRRLDVLMDGDEPVGGRWSFDTDNRKKLPAGHPVPDPRLGPARRHHRVQEAIEWVAEHAPGAPGDPETFCWPTSPGEAGAALGRFLDERFCQFGPYEDAISTEHEVLFHSALTPALNCGLIEPAQVLRRALAAADEQRLDLPSVEGFVRQLIGWREYLRATYRLWGRRMRTSNVLHHARDLPPGWWDATTGLGPVDLVIGRVLERGWAHHIERLMVLGNALCLQRVHPGEVWEWFMAMFVDAYDWVMVPNVYAMSQFAAAEAITTKPYVSGSNYLRKMSDLPPGEWTQAWDGLYWSFVADHRDVFESNPRAAMAARSWAAMDPAKKREHRAAARPWLR
ncbi:cryptochrome/photolyase family protein [Ruania suaedae]|uniref:cryptochrome/photolyase family protein n=1 Tax=Ruania suaedae TaxID=2897774 RepID=UPI001E41CD3A|nr:cryptochrome/photolyase family protein [Ruania suaedae]UFU01695.1 cryptochrome/photolyase family protein [Ruania suaedae]